MKVQKRTENNGVEILIVEDSLTQAEQLKYTLQQHDYRVSVAKNGKEALALIHKQKPTMVISDINMPEMDGYQLCRKIKTHEDLQDLPVILLTSLSDPADVVKGLECNADNFITKPYDEDYLLSRIHYILINRELCKSEKMQMGVEIFFAGQRYFITSERQQILNLLLSSYETAVQKNLELIQVQKALKNLNERLEEIVEQRTAKLKSEIAERKRAEQELRKAHLENEQLLAAIPSVLIGVDEGSRITRWNHVAEITFGMKLEDVVGRLLSECGIQWNWLDVSEDISNAHSQEHPARLDEIRFKRRDGKDGILGVTLNPFRGEKEKPAGFLLIGADITERKILEDQLRHAQKLESIGQLAAGIAHEINSPVQYVNSNTRFLQNSFGKLTKMLKKYAQLLEASETRAVTPELVAVVKATAGEVELEYLTDEIPSAIQESLEGIERVNKIVRSMKDFAHPGTVEKTAVDLNRAIESTITVARNEWKYVAEMVTDFDPTLPQVTCLLGEFNQMILNLIVNAAHAIADVVGEGGTGKGMITVSTRRNRDRAEIRISDTGTGIPEEFRSRIFDPFFTTKEVGRGTGQGLMIAHTVIVEKHGGTITFETEVGRGTTFIIHLPIDGTASQSRRQQ